jgi:molybdopterin converting factor small subunit
MKVPVTFWSYFGDLAGVRETSVELDEGGTIEQLLGAVYARHPKLGALRNSTLIAVGVEYQGPTYQLRSGDVVSLFPPVQGG